MDPIDAFPEHLSTTVVPVTLPDKPDALEYAARQGQVRAGIIYQEPTAKRVFVLFCKDHWHQKKKKDVVGQFQTGRHGGKACQCI
ncbi:uncharacterized protein TNCV_3097121 [Trichonephila clavipes]|uniref:Uncharacterized protein n=1 Tax=Trichonephila clavipes TaxID=2585209 RepID=A0A8X6VLD2_TRICX|nr:uncharacterized protein TNCV_3097121 [Trichonephila clavipes]